MQLNLTPEIEAKLNQLAERNGEGETLESLALALLIETLDYALEDYGSETPQEFEAWLAQNAA